MQARLTQGVMVIKLSINSFKIPFLIIALPLCVSSCFIEQNQFENIYQLDISKKIELPSIDTDYWSGYSEVLYYGDSIYLFRENHIFGNLQVYNLTESTLSKTIDFPLKGINGIKSGVSIGFIPFTLDSMYLVNRHNDLFQISQDKVILKYNMDFNGPNPILSATNETKLLQLKDSLFGIAQYKPFVFYSEEFMKSSVFAIYNTKSDTIVDTSVTYPPEIYLEKCWIPPLLRPSYTFNKKTERVIFSFPADHNLYEYDYQKDSLIQIKQEPNIYFDKIPSYQHCKQDRPRQDHYYMSTAHYSDIVYDPVNNVYFRFFLMPPEEIGVKEIAFVKKQLGVIILDEQFKIVNQTLFDPYQFLPKDYFINKEGLWLSNNNPENELFEEDRIEFTLLRITKDEKQT